MPGLSQNDIQGILGSHPSPQSINVKREPEDLRKEPKNSRSQKVSKPATSALLPALSAWSGVVGGADGSTTMERFYSIFFSTVLLHSLGGV